MGHLDLNLAFAESLFADFGINSRTRFILSFLKQVQGSEAEALVIGSSGHVYMISRLLQDRPRLPTS
jgi:hypothetical protein